TPHDTFGEVVPWLATTRAIIETPRRTCRGVSVSTRRARIDAHRQRGYTRRVRTTTRGGRAIPMLLLWMATVAATPSPVPEPPPPFGHVVYRAARVAGFESLGITMIACRHRDPVPRRFAVQFFD